MHQPVDGDPNQSPILKFIRMNTGEDIIAEITKQNDSDEEFFILINPMKILYSISQTHGGVSIALMQWIFPRICDKQEFPVYSSDIVTMCNPSEQMQTYYWNILNKLDGMGNRNYMEDEDEDYEEDDVEPTEEELEYINKMINEIKTGKRKLH
jgi:hypothetical protein